MKLVAFEEPIFSTIQGEGSRVGTPSVFLRLHGCNQQCEWCDTKGSWQSGSQFTELTVGEVSRKLLAEVAVSGAQDLVVTGGNPMLQAEEVDELLAITRGWRMVTIETNAYHDFVPTKRATASRTRLLWSLSPKVGRWDFDAVKQYIRAASSAVAQTVQVKIVVADITQATLAVGMLRLISDFTNQSAFDEGVTYILQPEYGAMRGPRGRELVKKLMDCANSSYMDGVPVRVIPQVHKFLAVR